MRKETFTLVVLLLVLVIVNTLFVIIINVGELNSIRESGTNVQGKVIQNILTKSLIAKDVSKIFKPDSSNLSLFDLIMKVA